MKTVVTRYHDFCYGHRVFGHENKCSRLHGHNGRVHFTVAGEDWEKDSIGRVIDFSEINKRLCNWLEENWDHKMLMFEQDPMVKFLKEVEPTLVVLPFNPTAENLAAYLVDVIGPYTLKGTNCKLFAVTFEETRKCSATYEVSHL